MSPVDDGGVLIFLDPHCGICFKHSHCPRRAWLLCAVKPTLWNPVCKSCALPLNTGYILGRLWPQGIRCSFSGSLERDREKKNYFELKIWPGTHSLLSCPRMCILGSYHGYIEDVWNIFMDAWVVANGQHLLRRRNLVWHCTLAI